MVPHLFVFYGGEMLKTVSFIELSGKSYPMKMDMKVMQEIQEIYGSIKTFELLLMGWDEDEEGKLYQKSEPSLTVSLWILPILIREGYEINGEKCELSNAEFIREVDINMMELANKIHEELKRAMLTKKAEPSQMIQSQIKTMTLMKKSRLTLIGCIYSAVRLWDLARKQ